MSKSYPQRGEEELAALSALESSIHRLANDFQGRRALNYYHESELAAYLIVSLRRNHSISEYVDKTRMYVAHLEWPCLVGRSIDLVLWKPGTVSTALNEWRYRSKLAKKLPLLAAVQIKRGPGKLSSERSTQKDIEILEDLHDVENLEKPVLYFLEWVDHDLKNHEHDRDPYQQIQSKLKKWCNDESNRRAFVISRDRVGFAYPKGVWLVDPLPPGVTENI